MIFRERDIDKPLQVGDTTACLVFKRLKTKPPIVQKARGYGMSTGSSMTWKDGATRVTFSFVR